MRPKPVVVLLLAQGIALQPVLALGAQAPPAEPKPAQEGAPPASQELPTFAVGAAAVTLDVVVRDKKGRAVRGLQASDFEVFEDGVKQRLDSFQVYGRPLAAEPGTSVAASSPPAAAPATPSAPAIPGAAAAPTPAEATPDSAASDSETRPQVIAFVFDRMSTNARNLARKAALTYVDKGHVGGDIVGIFGIDLALHTILPFTSEVGLVRGGLERAASQGNTQFASTREEARARVDTIAGVERIQDAAAAPVSGPQSGGAPAAAQALMGGAAVARIVNQMQVGILRTFESLERDQQGYASTNGLLSVVNGLKSLPGRKTVVFFSEGLVIPANVQAQFRSVIHAANRANVSVYAMDAAGLRTESLTEETRKEMMQANTRRLAQLESGRDDAPNGSMTRSLERNEDLLRLNPESGLSQLAKETGGFLIANTNDAASAFRRIEEDMRFHYLLAYSPSNENYDGRFRTISVKVSRPGVEVQSRQGYYAVKAIESAPLKAFEAPALVQLDRSPRPHAFPLQALGLSFPEPSRPGLAPVLVRVPGNTITYVPDREDKSGKKIHRAEFAVVVRVRNEAKQEVDRLSQRYPLSAEASTLDKARAGDLLFYREADLGPGRYTLEAVGYDAMAQKASVSLATLEVPPVTTGRLGMSSVVLVGRSEQVPPSEERKNPLYYGDTLLYPNLGEPLRRSTAPALGFFFTAYPGDAAAKHKATLEVVRGGQVVGQVETPLAAPDATGRIQYAGALPLQSFPPASYELRVTVTDGKSLEVRSSPFTVAE